ncbi:Uncharacterised protein [Mycobacteroides abscessus]|nr:Uncharacterised protein [Mycobacteroides abscessus]
MRGRVVSGDATTDHDHVGRADSGHTTHDQAASPHGGHQVVRPDLGGQPSGDLTHRGQQGERTVGGLYCLVRDRGGFRLQQRLRARQRGGQVQVGEERLATTHEGVFGFDRFLDLEEQIGLCPNLFGAVDHLCASGFEVHIRYRGAVTRARLNDHLVPATGQFGHTRGCGGHAILVVLDLGRYAYAHDSSSPVFKTKSRVQV